MDIPLPLESPITILDILPDCYGYVVFTACGSIFVNTWMALNVSRARKIYDVAYPDMYSVTSKEFNCIQRAHQNALENQPAFLTMLLLSGLKFPLTSTCAGMVYLAGRVAYAKGYSSGDPAKRRQGSFMHIGEFILLGTTLLVGCHIIRKCTLNSVLESLPYVGSLGCKL